MAEWRRHDIGSDEAVDDFDDFDPTPYGGGYDLVLTFGRPIPPSDETCYPPNAANSSSDTGVDYERPNYSGSARPSSYRYESQPASDEGYGGYGRRPQQEEAYEEQRPYSFEGDPRPQYGYGGQGRPSEYDSSYGRRSEEQSHGYGDEERSRSKPYRQEQSYDYEGGNYESEGRQEYGRSGSGEYGYGERPRYGQRGDEDYGRRNSGEDSDEEKEERRRYRRQESGDD
ncbi:unnamed protein product [Spirodela intermedia]|uniref:Uncharacterized protein n=1 Tax=Spirodela intermedia TaxID=51605 RepID=A0A7I8IPF9_SPIIN|nr:unnamed protein product [Spirodela intermedia]CAA6659759.1 unnamed protein product [Spirodela intermedia]